MGDGELESNKELLEKKKFTIYDYFLILFEYRFFFIVNTIVLVIIAVIISLVLPKWYKASTSVLQPKEQLISSLSMSSSVSRGLSLQRLTSSNQMANPYNYLAILKSRSVFEAVINKFDLIDVYNIKSGFIEDAIKELEGNVNFEIQNEEYLLIEVYDKDPVRAADIANYFVELLNAKSVQLFTQEAKENRVFLENRLAKIHSELKVLEDSIKYFQLKEKIYLGTLTNESGIARIAELYALRTKKEIELGILEKTLGTNNPTVVQQKLELRELENKLSIFPEISVIALRLYRDYMICQKTLEYLTPMYEQAKVDEQKTIPAILVLDKAKPPQKKAKPKRIYIVLSAVVLSVVMWLLVAVKKMYVLDLQYNNSLEYTKYQQLKIVLRNIFQKRIQKNV